MVTGADWLAAINEARALHERAEDRRNNPIECPEHRWPLEHSDGVYHCKFGGHIVTTPTHDK